MSVGILLVINVDVAADENVTDAFEVLARHILGVHHREAHLVVLDWLWCDVPDLLLFALLVARLNLEPAGDHTLRQRGAWMVNLAVLDRLLFDGLPVSVEEAIVKIDRGLTDKIITEQIIVVIGLNLDLRGTWELTCELEEFVDFRVGLIKKIIVALREFTSTTSDQQVWITERSNITRGKVETFKNVKLDDALCLAQKLLLDYLIV